MPLKAFAHLDRLRRVFATLVMAMVLLGSFAAYWMPLHEWMHGDAGGDREDDDCAVVMMAAGYYQMETPVPVRAPARKAEWVALLQTEYRKWVACVFCALGVWEHAPPVAG